MTDVTPFQFENHSVRVVVLDGEPWFVVLDVCRALEIANARDAAARIDREDVVKTDVLTAGGQQQMWVVNESGLYELIFASNKPEARRFRRWVTKEVLPQIRKTGSYSTTLSPAEMLLQQCQMLVEQERRTRAIEEQNRRIAAEQRRISSRQEAQDEILDDLGGEIGTLRVDVETLKENHERVTAIGYANLRKIRSDVDFLRQLGTKAASLARYQGVPISRAHSTVWGEVNAWPLEIWDEAYETLSRKFGV
jgi:prophage antirepressor-like protein